MDIGIMWIFLAPMIAVIIWAMAKDILGRHNAKKQRAEYENSLKIQAEEVELLRQLVVLQKDTNRQLEAIQNTLNISNSSHTK